MVLAEDLRQAVLQAALQGKLTEQLDTDSNVDDLLERINKRKETLIEAREIKKSKTDLSVDEDDFLFQIPSNWRWVKLGKIAEVKGGKRVPVGETLVEVDTGHKYIRVADMKNGTVDESGIKYITDEVYSVIKNYYITKNDIYITVAGTIGRVGSIPDTLDMANLTENADKIIFEYLNKEWFINVLNSKILQWQIVQATKKVGQPKLALNRIETLLIPLPPIEEQQRIVDKINGIMPKIDEYEKIEKELEALKKEFPTNMKDALLQAAMQGKLTEQLESDSSVDELLQKIGEKELKCSNWKAKKEFEIDEILDIIDSPIIPNSWRWVKLSDIALSNIGLTYKPSDKTLDGVIVLRSSNIQNGKMDYNDIVKVNMVIPKNKMCDIGDILMCVRNGSKSLVGKVAMIDKSNMSFGAFMSIIKSRCNQFLYYFFTSNIFKKQMHINSSTETINQITQDMLFNCVIPLPPIEEQQRIVKRLDILLPLCEGLS